MSSDFQEQMNPVEALMWSLDADPVLSSTFANITWLDRAPDAERLRRRMWRATRVVPRLRRRVVEGFGPTPPSWEEDPDFDLDFHLKFVTLPPGATDADVRAFAVTQAATPFDRSRPLWEYVVLDGLADGRAAMVQKMHHTITDGKGGIRMSIEFIDLERDAPEPPPIPGEPYPEGPDKNRRTGTDCDGIAGERTESERTEGRSPESAGRNTIGAAALPGLSALQAPLASAFSSLLSSAKDPVGTANQIGSLISTLPAETAATAKSLVRQLGVTDSARSPLWRERSLDRTLETFDVSLEDTKVAAANLGGSVNDLFVAAAAGGAGAYHRRFGIDIDELRISMPVSNRTDRSPGGNAFTPTRVLVPVGADPIARFNEIHDRLAVTKTEKAMNFVNSAAGAVNLLPRQLLVQIARQQVSTVDFATSNVRAAPFPLYIAGAMLTANYPVGPIAGTAWNVTTMSYLGVLHLGLHADTAAVKDPAALRDEIAASFDELIRLGTPKAKPRPRQGAKRQ